jgi:hypothetical protein
MSTAAEKKKAFVQALEATSALCGGSAYAEPYQLLKLRKAADTLGCRKELDEFMKDTWQMTVRARKKK